MTKTIQVTEIIVPHISMNPCTHMEINHSANYQLINDEELNSIVVKSQVLAGSKVIKSSYLLAIFSECQFYAVEFQDVSFDNCIFDNCIFDFSHFKNCHFNNCSFENCTLKTTSTLTDCFHDHHAVVELSSSGASAKSSNLTSHDGWNNQIAC